VRRIWITIIAVVVVAVLGWLDYVTGPDIGFSLFYLVPIVICGWFGGVTAGVIVALAAAIAWLTADVAWHSVSWGVSVWNGFTRAVIYVTQGWMMARLKREREELREQLGHQARLARTDAATSLPNARAFLEAADASLRHARDAGWQVCMLYIDLDDFKRVNDLFGHRRGDEILQRVGSAILGSVRVDDLPARIGGDEFVVLLLNVDMAVAAHVAQRIHDRIEAEESDGTRIACTIGGAHFSVVPDKTAQLIAEADRAMYEAKAAGKQRVLVRPAH